MGGTCGQDEPAAAPGGFGQRFQTSDAQLGTDGIVKLGRVGVWRLKSISEHLFASFHQLADQRGPGRAEKKKKRKRIESGFAHERKLNGYRS